LVPVLDSVVLDAVSAGTLGLLTTALLLGIRHGFDWDHIAAITDVTSTTAAAVAGEAAHERRHELGAHGHAHGGTDEAQVHAVELGAPSGSALVGTLPSDAALVLAATPTGFLREQRRAIALGTLYALGHATVVAALGLGALAFGALLPGWVDPIMGRVVGLTLLLLGVWVFVSLYQYARYGVKFRLRSRWMLVFDGIRHLWRRFQARLHGHRHVDPVEMSSYGAGTAFAVGMIHGVGAETGSQVLLIAAIGGATSAGLGIPMMLAFIVGLLISNSLIVVITATGFIASQLRTRLYVVVGVAAGVFSLLVGTAFLLGIENVLPDLERVFSFIGS
jgi:high-affinity nickel permease